MTKNVESQDENTEKSSSTPPKQSLVEFLRQSPLMGLELDLERDKSPARDIDFGSDESVKYGRTTQ
jgi:hypothetical protein